MVVVKYGKGGVLYGGVILKIGVHVETHAGLHLLLHILRKPPDLVGRPFGCALFLSSTTSTSVVSRT